MKRLPWKNIYFTIALSLLASMGMKYCVNVGDGSLVYTNSAVSFLFLCALMFGLKKITTCDAWNSIVDMLNSCFIFAFCFWGSMAAGVSLECCGRVNFTDWRRWSAVLLLALTTAPILGWIIKSFNVYGRSQRGLADLGKERTKGRKYFFCVFGILLLAYMLPFLASFPGFFTYDAETEVYMVFTNKYSAHHPVLHVLLLGWIIRAVY